MFGHVKSLVYSFGESYLCNYISDEGAHLTSEVSPCPKYGWNRISNGFHPLSLEEERDNDLIFLDVAPTLCFDGLRFSDNYSGDDVDYLFFHEKVRGVVNHREEIDLDLYNKKYSLESTAKLEKFVETFDPLYNLQLAASTFNCSCEEVLTMSDADLIKRVFPQTTFYETSYENKGKKAKYFLNSEVLNVIINAPDTVYVQLIYSSHTEENERRLFEDIIIEDCDICS